MRSAPNSVSKTSILSPTSSSGDTILVKNEDGASPVAEDDEKMQPSSRWEVYLQETLAEILNVPMDSIRRDTSFLELGGDSMSAMQLILDARDQGLPLTMGDVFSDPRLLAIAAKATERADQVVEDDEVAPFSLLSQEAREVFSEGRFCDVSGLPDNLQIEDAYPCTSYQEDLMATSTKHPSSNIAKHALKLPEDIDIELFKSAWDQVTVSCSNLRTRIVLLDGSAVQAVIRGPMPLEIAHEKDLRSAVQAFQNLEMSYGSQLSQAQLAKTDDGELHLLWAVHESISDGWTMGLISATMSRVYYGYDKMDLQPYVKFIKYNQDLDREAAQNFWERQLRGVKSSMFPQPPHGKSVDSVPRVVRKRLAFPQNRNQSVIDAVSIRAAWGMVLAHYCDTADVCFGSTVSHRDVPLVGSEMMPGCMMATVPVRIQMSLNKTVSEFLQDVQSQAAEMVPYQQYGLQNIANIAGLRDACDFTSMLVVQPSKHFDAAAYEQSSVMGISQRMTEMNEETDASSKCPLVVQGNLHTNHVEFVVTHNPSSIAREDVLDLVQHLSRVLEQLMDGENAFKKLGDVFPTFTPLRPELLLFSAPSDSALRQQVRANRGFVQSHDFRTSDLAYTLGQCREAQRHRAFSILHDGRLTNLSAHRQAAAEPPKITMVFSGQGAEWAGMGRELLLEDGCFADDIDRMDKALSSLLNAPSWSLTGKCFPVQS